MPVLKNCFVALSLLVLTSTAARADSLTTGGFYSGDQNNFSSGEITFTLNGVQETAGAGNIAGSSVVASGINASLPQMFCVDLLHDIYLNTTYAANFNVTGAVEGAAVNDAGQIAWLLSNLAPSDSTTAQNEGLQAAIWSVEYGSAFTFLPGSNTADVDSAYSADLAALGSNSAAVNSVMWITPVNGDGSFAQAQVALVSPAVLTALAPAPTPEPASLWLLGTGLLGAAGAIRRRITRTEA